MNWDEPARLGDPLSPFLMATYGFGAWMLAQQTGVTPEEAYAAMRRAQHPAEKVTVKGAAEMMERAYADLVPEVSAAPLTQEERLAAASESVARVLRSWHAPETTGTDPEEQP